MEVEAGVDTDHRQACFVGKAIILWKAGVSHSDILPLGCRQVCRRHAPTYDARRARLVR